MYDPISRGVCRSRALSPPRAIPIRRRLRSRRILPVVPKGSDVTAPEESTFADLGKVLVIIPTYNEAENIERIVSRVRAAVPEAHVLVADDNSPDGTGDLADKLATDDAHVRVLHRKGKEGLGAAYLAGFRWGIDEGYAVLVEMDADGSHQPEELPGCSPRCAAPTSSSARAGCPAARSSTGPSPAC
ncbi:hypothetical protein GCM10025734_44480 [Kitasatospora paranensis]